MALSNGKRTLIALAVTATLAGAAAWFVYPRFKKAAAPFRGMLAKMEAFQDELERRYPGMEMEVYREGGQSVGLSLTVDFDPVKETERATGLAREAVGLFREKLPFAHYASLKVQVVQRGKGDDRPALTVPFPPSKAISERPKAKPNRPRRK